MLNIQRCIAVDCTGSPATMKGSGNPSSRLEAALEQPRCSSGTWQTPIQLGNFLAASSAPALDVLRAPASWRSDTWHAALSASLHFLQHGQRALQGGDVMSHQHQEAAELAVRSGDMMDYVTHADKPSAGATGNNVAPGIGSHPWW